MNPDKDLAAKLDECIKTITEKQEQINRKTKDIKAYKECNEKLIKLVKLIVFSSLVIFVALLVTLGYTVSQYKDLKNSVYTTTETTRQEFQTQDGGLIINGDGNSGSVNATEPTK